MGFMSEGIDLKTTPCRQFHVPVCEKAQRKHSPHASHYRVTMTSSELTRNQQLRPPSDESESVLMNLSFHHTDKP